MYCVLCQKLRQDSDYRRWVLRPNIFFRLIFFIVIVREKNKIQSYKFF